MKRAPLEVIPHPNKNSVDNKKKKTSRQLNEQKSSVRFRRFIYGLNEANVLKRKEYANKPETKHRRKILSDKHRALNKILVQMLVSGNLRDSEGNELSCIYNCLVIKDKKLYAIIDKKKEIHWKPYDEETELGDTIPVDKTPTREDIEVSRLIDGFVNGDENVLNMFKEKRTIITTADDHIKNNYSNLKEKIEKKKFTHNGEQPLIELTVKKEDDSSDEEIDDSSISK